jgi:DNA-binding SARP family transcriptional activator
MTEVRVCGARMRYELLGSLRIVNGSRQYAPSASKIEMVLAALLVESGRLVSKERLIEELWVRDPPRRAAAAVHVYISQLRRFLGAAGDVEKQAIVTKPGGYRFSTDDVEFDVTDFRDALRQGQAYHQAAEFEGALQEFERALSLVRGQVLDGFAEGPILSSFAAWVEEERLQCLETSVEVHLLLGRHREVNALLYGLIEEYPLRESFYRQLMLVLYRSERQVEALAVYRAAQRVLRAELGLEPCLSLRRLHQAILKADHRLDLGLLMAN